ncbi:FecR domain-containing protein [Alphaproteobacteria bacterium]|nr:FecR domain-containing protein [Alphaproteobacteria bacterium]
MTMHKKNLIFKRWPQLVVFCAVVFAPVQIVFAATDITKIGVTTIVKNKVLGEPPKMVKRNLTTGLEVYFNEKVETGPVGRTQLLFKDGTAITIGPNANMTIDKYVFDPNAGTGEMALSVTKGVFRIVGGRISKRKPIKLKTPVATLGVMGGIVVVDQAANGKLNADFLFGNKMTVTANNVTVTTKIPGRFISVTGSGQAPGPSQKRDRAEMKKNLEKLEGGGAEEKSAAPEEKAAPKKTETASSEGSNTESTEEKKVPTAGASEVSAEESNEAVPAEKTPAASEKSEPTPVASGEDPAPVSTGGSTEMASAPMPGGESGSMPMPGNDGGIMPMPGGESGIMPMPGFDPIEPGAPLINVGKIMPPNPVGPGGLPMLPMPEPGLGAPGPGVGEAPGSIAGDIGNGRNDDLIKEPEVLRGASLALLSPDEILAVNNVLRDSQSGFVVAEPPRNADGSINLGAPPSFSAREPGGEGLLPGLIGAVPEDGGFTSPPEGFAPPLDPGNGTMNSGNTNPSPGDCVLTDSNPCDSADIPRAPGSENSFPGNGEGVTNPDNGMGVVVISEPIEGVTNPDNGMGVVVISEPIEGVTTPDNGRGVVVTSEPMVMGLTTLPTSSLALISVANSPALTYLIDNPDVMIHAQNIVKRTGVEPGRGFQRAMESVALEHYNSFGRNEGRHLDGLNPSTTLTLQSEANTVQPKAIEQLINVSGSAALTYLVNNPDVMTHAQRIVRASRIAPGRDFQRAMERAAIEHYNRFGLNEGRVGFGR